MIELAELRQRVKAAGVRFREAAEEDRKRNERLSILLGVVEEGLNNRTLRLMVYLHLPWRDAIRRAQAVATVLTLERFP